MEESDIRPGMIPQEGNCVNTFVCHCKLCVATRGSIYLEHCGTF